MTPGREANYFESRQICQKCHIFPFHQMRAQINPYLNTMSNMACLPILIKREPLPVLI